MNIFVKSAAICIMIVFAVFVLFFGGIAAILAGLLLLKFAMQSGALVVFLGVVMVLAIIIYTLTRHIGD